jgi:Ice-binding-like
VCESDVNWGLAGAATLGANTAFVGNILDAAGITIGQNASLTGRALAFGGTVTVPLTPATITVPICAAAPAAPAAAVGGPTLDFVGLAILILLLTGVGVLLVNRFTL